MSNDDNFDVVSKGQRGASLTIYAVISASFRFVFALVGNSVLYAFKSGILGSVKLQNVNYIRILPNSVSFSSSNSGRSGTGSVRPKQIGSAIERGGVVYVYDETGAQICGLGARGFGQEDGLKGYTSNTVSIRRGDVIYIYDAQGRQISAAPATPAHFNR